MIYVKSIVEGKEVRTGIVENCFFSDCPVCGEQVHVNFGLFMDIMDDGSPETTSVYCDPCSDKYREENKPIVRKLSRIK